MAGWETWWGLPHSGSGTTGLVLMCGLGSCVPTPLTALGLPDTAPGADPSPPVGTGGYRSVPRVQEALPWPPADQLCPQATGCHLAGVVMERAHDQQRRDVTWESCGCNGAKPSPAGEARPASRAAAQVWDVASVSLLCTTRVKLS